MRHGDPQDSRREDSGHPAGTPLVEPVVFNLQATSPEKLRRDGGWLGHVLVLTAAKYDPAERFRATLGTVVRDLEAMPEEQRERWLDFMAYTISLVFHSRAPAERASLEHTIIAALSNDDNRRELRAMLKSIADAIRDEGRSIATLETSRAMLLRLLERRFGALPEAIRATIERTDDVDQLTHWLDQVVTVDTLGEVGIE